MNTIRVLTLGVVAVLALSACVTINVYFPAAAAEKAADAIIEEVWGEQGADDATVEPQSRLTGTRFATVLLDFVFPAAHAEADLEISTPAVNKIKASMRKRHRELSAFYDAGAAGLTRDGLIAVRDAKQVALNKRNRLKELVADENKDRNALYKALAKANGHPEWEPDIRNTFAGRWISKARSGWWYDVGNGWQQK